MKRLMKTVSLLLLVLAGITVFTSSAFAEDKINLKLTKAAESIVLQWNGSKKETYTVYKKTGKGKYVKTAAVKGKKYTDANVQGGQTYSYYIKKGKKLKSESKATVYLPAPKMQKSSVSASGITVKWSKAEGAESYVVYRKAQGDKKKKIATVTGTSYKDTEAQKNIIYTYTVKSVRGEVSSVTSSVKTGRFSAPALTSLTRTADGLLLKWSKIEKAEKYAIYRKKASGKWKKIASVSSSVLSYEDKSLSDGARYSYYVRAEAGQARSLYSKNISEICIKAPRGFTAESRGKNLTLKWSKSEGATAYQVYKKTEKGKWKKIKDVKGTSYSETLKDTKTRCYYRVCVVTDKGTSAYTAVKTNRVIDPSKPMVALTYDDGPHPVQTHRILDVLEKYDARATFFVVGSRIEAYSDCLARQNELGCEVANHSYSHSSLSAMSKKELMSEIEKTDRLIEKYSGQTPALVRAPGGSIGKAATASDKPFIQWSVDTLDWDKLSSSYVVSHIKRTACDGSIILMHDLYASTAAASEKIIPWLISEGYQLVTVTELLEARNGEIKGGEVYFNGYKS